MGIAAEQAGGYAAGVPLGPLSGDGIGDVLERLRRARSVLRAVVDVDLTTAAATELGGALDEVVGLKRTVAAVEAKVLAAAERVDLAGAMGAVDTIALLKDRAQLSGRDAKRAIDLGRKLERLPGTAAALADGELGVEQAEQVANGVLLCVRHHHLCHEGGWKLTMHGHTRVVTVVSPDGLTRLTSQPRGIIPRTATTRRRTG